MSMLWLSLLRDAFKSSYLCLALIAFPPNLVTHLKTFLNEMFWHIRTTKVILVS